MGRLIRQRAQKALALVERTARRLRRRLAPPKGDGIQPEETNSPEDWARLYEPTITAVGALCSPLATALAGLSQPGETLLEAGCGSATISAELSREGRVVELADFSQAILDRAVKLFANSGLPTPGTTLADLTKPLPWAANAVDITWSSGVLEHWTDEELVPIVAEMARISRRRVVSLVPYAGSLFYRFGKWEAEATGIWPYGRELPRESLRAVFERAGLRNVAESTVWSEQALEFTHYLDPELRRRAREWWASLAEDDILRRTQGYLLLTIGEKT